MNSSKFQLGELFTPEKLDRALKNIKQLMEENGYYRSSVSDAEETNPGTQQVGIAFTIRPGSQAHVGLDQRNRQPGIFAGANP